MHDDLKQRLRDGIDAELGTRPPSDLSEVLIRGRGKRRALRLMTTLSMILFGTAVVAGGMLIGRSLSSDDVAPVPPAEERRQEIEPMRNGRITTSRESGQEWHAFDQETGLFYYFKYWRERAFVFGQDGPVAQFDCPPSADCEFATAFGPGPDELTMPAGQPGEEQSLLVLAFDGVVRQTLDISPAITQDQRITDLAWSPDESRLAISTAPSCDNGNDPCEGKVWTMEADGSKPQVVFTERAPADLGWSPDGLSLTVLVSSDVVKFDDVAHDGVWPKLVALRFRPGQPVGAETLHVYDDVGLPAWNDVPDGWRFYFASAWSPDGTRIAVTSKDGFAEISAEDGHVLARHPSKDPRGLLAWLPKN